MSRPYGIHIGAVVQYRHLGVNHAAIVIAIPDTDPELGNVIVRVLVPRVALNNDHDRPVFLEPTHADFDTVAQYADSPGFEGCWSWGRTHPLYDITTR